MTIVCRIRLLSTISGHMSAISAKGRMFQLHTIAGDRFLRDFRQYMNKWDIFYSDKIPYLKTVLQQIKHFCGMVHHLR